VLVLVLDFQQTLDDQDNRHFFFSSMAQIATAKFNGDPSEPANFVFIQRPKTGTEACRPRLPRCPFHLI
jgi:hypothetical protein